MEVFHKKTSWVKEKILKKRFTDIVVKTAICVFVTENVIFMFLSVIVCIKLGYGMNYFLYIAFDTIVSFCLIITECGYSLLTDILTQYQMHLHVYVTYV